MDSSPNGVASYVILYIQTIFFSSLYSDKIKSLPTHVLTKDDHPCKVMFGNGVKWMQKYRIHIWNKCIMLYEWDRDPAESGLIVQN